MKHKKAKKNYDLRLNALFYKELGMTTLAIVSILLLLFEYVADPDPATRQIILRFDFIVAVIFLIDFLVSLYSADDKQKYFNENWFLLLASIPIADAWAELLRGLRILELIRLMRAGSHLSYVYSAVKAKK